MILVATPLRNEARRFLPPWLDAVTAFADRLLVLDDASTDASAALCRSRGALVYTVPHPLPEGARRTLLWELVRAEASEGDLVFLLDADELPSAPLLSSRDEVRRLGCTSCRLSLPLLELWDATRYRVDGLWSPLLPAAVSFQDLPFRRDGQPDPRSLHVPRLPSYASTLRPRSLDLPLIHMAYSRPALREQKASFYLEHNQGLDLAHARTILDPAPVLRSVDELLDPQDLLLSVPIRDRAWMVPALTDSLEALRWSRDRLRVCFYLNDCTDETGPLLEAWCEDRAWAEVLPLSLERAPPTREHHWHGPRHDPAGPLARMAALRNAMLEDFERSGADLLFLLDSDVLLHPSTPGHLASLGRDIISPLFWASWGNEHPTARVEGDTSGLRQDQLLTLAHMAAGRRPQVWERGGFEMSGAFLQGLVNHVGLHRVGGLGAATLIRRRVVEAGVDYSRVDNLPSNMVGEDRDFCVRAVCAGFDLWASNMLPTLHCDGPGDQDRWQLEVMDVDPPPPWPSPYLSGIVVP